MSHTRAPERPPDPGGSPYRLGLFPLPVVLMPGTAMPLHIFEERYRDLLRDALEGDRRFGMVYHDWDRAGPFMNDQGRVGCVAQIRDHRALEDGRSLIVVDGLERFRIEDGLELEELYFEALVQPYRDAASPEAPDLTARRRRSIELFRAVIGSAPGSSESLPDLVPDREVSFLLAQTMAVDPAWHQDLLELRDEAERLDRVDAVLRAALG